MTRDAEQAPVDLTLIALANAVSDLRVRMVEWLGSADGARYSEHVAAETLGHAPASGDTSEVQRNLLTMWSEAELFSIMPDMAAVVDAASRSAPLHAWTPQLLPAPTGVALFARPLRIASPSNPDEMTSIHALAWQPSEIVDRDGVVIDGVSVYYYTHQSDEVDAHAARLLAGVQKGVDITPVEAAQDVAHTYGPMLFLGFLPATWGVGGALVDDVDAAGLGPEVDIDLDLPINAGAPVARIAQTLFLLCGQQIAVTSSPVLARGSRRRAQQAQLEPAVRVVQLRQKTGPAGEQAAPRQWHHRWVVRGHWRAQRVKDNSGAWTTRPTWIHSHLKGPDDAPMIGGEKVYVLHR